MTVVGTELIRTERPTNARVLAVALLPESVAEDGHGRRAFTLVLREEIAAEQWTLADQRECI
jgi:hypothetical protein